MTEIHWAAARGFASAAEMYERARPSYPAEAVSWLAERLDIGPGREVLDLAAGTGKLTRLLWPHGARVLAVEPVAEMRARLEAALPAVRALAGTAESLPLADASVDAVTCAQAFHWFRHDEALREIHRVLRPGGALALVWNTRDPADPLGARIDALLAPYRERAARFGDRLWRQALDRSALFGRVEERAWPYGEEATRERIVERYASVSVVAALPDDERAALLGRIRAALEAYDEPIRVPYVTEVYVVDPLPLPSGRSARMAP